MSQRGYHKQSNCSSMRFSSAQLHTPTAKLLPVVMVVHLKLACIALHYTAICTVHVLMKEKDIFLPPRSYHLDLWSVINSTLLLNRAASCVHSKQSLNKTRSFYYSSSHYFKAKLWEAAGSYLGFCIINRIKLLSTECQILCFPPAQSKSGFEISGTAKVYGRVKHGTLKLYGCWHI